MRSALLAPGVCALALGVALASVFLPAAAYNRQPDVTELVAGLALIACGADLVASSVTRVAGCLLVLSGAAWFLPSLATAVSGPLGEALGSLQLLHVPFVAAALLAVGGSARSRLSSTSLLLLVLVAVAGSVGGYAVLLPLGGAALVVATVWSAARVRDREPVAVVAFLLAGLGYGFVLISLSLLRWTNTWLNGAELETTYDLAVAAVAVLVLRVGPWLGSDYVIDVGADRLLAVERSVAELLDDETAQVVLQGDDGRWRGLSSAHEIGAGQRVTPLGSKVGVAARSPLDSRVDRIGPAMRDGLSLVARNVRLRLSTNDRLEEVVDLRRRLVTVDQEERAALVRRLRIGPFAQLDDVRGHLRAAGAEELAVGVEVTRHALEALAAGLDPLGERTLAQALDDMLRGLPAATFTPGPVSVSREGATSLLFAGSEAVTNALKHAPGARVAVTLHQEGAQVVLVVSDDGPGARRSDLPVLAGVATRLEAVSGQVHVETGPSGTRITACVPSDDTGQHVSGSRGCPEVTASDPVHSSFIPNWRT